MSASNLLLVGRWYHLRVMIGGKRITEALGTDLKPEARRRAAVRIRELRDAARRGTLEELREAERAQGPVARIGEVFERFLGAVVLPVGARARMDYCAMLRRVVRVARGDEGLEVDGLGCDVLTEALGREFQRRWLERVRGKGPAAENSARVSANAMLTQARSVFSKRAMRAGIYQGLHLGGGLAGWLAVEKVKCDPVQNYVPPAPEMFGEMERAAEALRAEDVAVYLIWMIGIRAGLRRGEVVAMRWAWVQGDAVVIPARDGNFKVKGKRSRTVPLRPGLAAELREVCAAAGFAVGPDDFVLPGASPSARLNHYRRLGKWMRSLGWARRKTSHELRAQAATRMLEGNDLFAVQQALGHQQLETTRRYVPARQIKPI